MTCKGSKNSEKVYIWRESTFLSLHKGCRIGCRKLLSLIVASILALRPVLRNLWEHLPSASADSALILFDESNLHPEIHHSGIQGFLKLTSVKFEFALILQSALSTL